MTERAILSIEIDDTQFQAFRQQFAAFKAESETMPKAWKATDDQVAAVKANFEKMRDILQETGQHGGKLNASTKKRAKASKSTSATFASIYKSSKMFASNVHSATIQLERWTKLTAVISGVLGAGGLFGINRMAAGVAAKRQSAGGLGLSVGELQAFQNAFSPLGNTEALLSGFNLAQNDRRERAPLYAIGVGKQTENMDGAQAFVKALPALRETLRGLDPSNLQQSIQARGLDKLGVDLPTALNIRAMTDANMAGMIKQYQGNVAPLDLSPDVALAWVNLSTQLNRAWGELEPVLAHDLVGLAVPLTDLSDKFVDLFTVLTRKGSPIPKWLQNVSDKLSDFAGYLESPDFKAFGKEAKRKLSLSKKDFEALNTWFAAHKTEIELFAASVAAFSAAAVALGGVAALRLALSAAGFGVRAAVAAGGFAARAAVATGGFAARAAVGAGEVVAGAGVGGTAALAGGILVGSKTGLNAGENERERQRKYGLGTKGTSAPPDSEAGSTAAPYGGKAPTPLSITPGRRPDTKDVDPRLNEIMAAAATHLPPGYKVQVNEGYNPFGHVARSQHHIKGRGALDLRIVDPSGHAIPNEGGDPTRKYHTLARAAYGEMLERHPELKGKLAWGGAFGSSRGNSAQDLMHFDIGNSRGPYAANRLENMGPLPIKKPEPEAPSKKVDVPATEDPKSPLYHMKPWQLRSDVHKENHPNKGKGSPLLVQVHDETGSSSHVQVAH
jgi:hypothetical protein